MTLTAVAVTAANFAPFGALVCHEAGVPLAVVSAAFAHHKDATLPALEWVRPASHITLPTLLNRLEKHPFSAQTFLPHRNSPFLVVVCATGLDGLPDTRTLQAFLVPSDTGVTFGRGVWHRSLAPLEPASGYTMAMMRTGRDDDTVFHDLADPITVTADAIVMRDLLR